MTDTFGAVVRRRLCLAQALAWEVALRRDGTVAAHKVLPASALTLEAQPLPATIIGAALLLALRPHRVGPATVLAAVGTNETDIAIAPSIHAKPVSRAVVGARAHLQVQRGPLARRPLPTAFTAALARTEGGNKGAFPMSATTCRTVWFSTARSRPPHLAMAGSVEALAMVTARRDADAVSAGVLSVAPVHRPPARNAHAHARSASTMAAAIDTSLQETSTTLNLAPCASEKLVANAQPLLRVAHTMPGAKPTFSANRSRLALGREARCCFSGVLFFQELLLAHLSLQHH
mmetsp:Transcript_109154/g.307754  ORF Transcript_109154/g.307754 Transcript_109154/m.307754 type:complete len:290 (-) Transcript_109154:2179-3048(-)